MALFSPGRGGGATVTVGYKGKGLLVHLLVDGQGRPLVFRLTGANGNEHEQAVNLLRECKDKLKQRPRVLQADRGYDSKRVRGYAEYICGIYTSIPSRQYDHERRGQYRPPVESTHNNRWIVERTFAWLYKKYRRLSTRWERTTAPSQGFFHAALCKYWLEIIIG